MKFVFFVEAPEEDQSFDPDRLFSQVETMPVHHHDQYFVTQQQNYDEADADEGEDSEAERKKVKKENRVPRLSLFDQYGDDESSDTE